MEIKEISGLYKPEPKTSKHEMTVEESKEILDFVGTCRERCRNIIKCRDCKDPCTICRYQEAHPETRKMECMDIFIEAYRKYINVKEN